MNDSEFYSGMINAPRNRVRLLGYTLSSGQYNGMDCIWYERNNDPITFKSSHIIIDGGLWFIGSIALIVWTVLCIMIVCSSISFITFMIGLLISILFMIYSVNIVGKLLF